MTSSASAARLKNQGHIDAMRRAGLVASSVVRTLLDDLEPGQTTAQIGARARVLMEDAGAEGLFRGYSQQDAPPFPGDVCASVNDQVVHGVPDDRPLRAGDLVSLDCGLRLDGWCADHAMSAIVGGANANPAAARLIEASLGVLEHGIERMVVGARWSSVGRAMEEATEATGFGLVTEYVGHGIGRDLHEPPKAPSYWSGYSGPDFQLREGLVLALEPILTLSRGSEDAEAGELPGWRARVVVDDRDQWTVRTADGALACHVEHTIAVTSDGPRVLTRP